MRNKIFLVLMIAVLMFALTACGEEKKHVAANTEGDIKCLSINEIYDNEEFGFYVKNSDQTFSPVMAGAEGYSGQAQQTDPTRYVWWSNVNTKESQIDYEKLIPTVTKKNPLVLVYKTIDDFPERFVLEKYKNLGFTIGSTVTLSDTGDQMFLMSDNFCKRSDYARKIEGKEIGASMEVVRINDKKKLPYKNVDTDINKLIGLEEGKLYKFRLHIGTRTVEADFIADTEILKADEKIELTIPYKTTDKHYFVVSLPDNLKSGYYYINDAGLFRYEAE